MKKGLWVLAAALLLGAGSAAAQFKADPRGEGRITDGLLVRPSASALFGWFDPARFHMSHSLSVSYQTFGNQGLSLSTYTNSMLYDFADNLRAQADVSLMYSPWSSFGRQGGMDLGGLFLSRAQVDYRPWENFLVQVQYRNAPYEYYPWGGYYRSRMWER
ncbi:MAG: hypothetical protein WB626_10800 [Bacteroidota bacterium]